MKKYEFTGETAGEKTIEVRTNWPRAVTAPFVILFYETGNGGGSKQVRAKAVCCGYDTLYDSNLRDGNATVRNAFTQKKLLVRK